MEIMFGRNIAMKELDFSVVVPIYNEQGNIKVLDKEIREVMNKLGT